MRFLFLILLMLSGGLWAQTEDTRFEIFIRSLDGTGANATNVYIQHMSTSDTFNLSAVSGKTGSYRRDNVPFGKYKIYANGSLQTTSKFFATNRIYDFIVNIDPDGNHQIDTQGYEDNSITGTKIASSEVVKSINSLQDNVVLKAGSGVGIASNGTDTLTISSTGGGSGGGDITAVTSGAGLSGGGSTGDVSLFIGNDQVVGSMIGDDQISGGHIADGAIDSDQLAALAVISSKLQTDAVTNAKVADDAIDSTNIADRAVKGPEIADDAVISRHIADDAITGAMIGDDQVSGTHIADGAVDAAQLASLAVTTAKLQSQAVTSAKIANGAVDAAQIATDAVGNTQMADNAVGSAEITNGSITNADIGDDQIIKNVRVNASAFGQDSIVFANGSNATFTTSNDTIYVNSTASGSGDITGVTAGSGLSGGGSSGDVTVNIDTEGVKRVHLSDAAKEVGNFIRREILATDSAYGAAPSNSAAANNTAFTSFFTDLRNGTNGDTLSGYISDGRYQVSATQPVGDGVSSAILRGGSTSFLEMTIDDTIIATTGFNAELQIDNLGFEGNGKNNNAIGISLGNTSGGTKISHSTFDSIGTGIYTYDNTTLEISNNTFDENSIGIHSNFQADNQLITQNGFSDNDTSIFIEGTSASGPVIFSNTIGQSDVVDIAVTSGAGHLAILHNYSEDSKGQVWVGTDNGNVNDGSRTVQIDGWNSQQGGAHSSGDSIFYFFDTDFITFTNSHHTGTVDSTFMVIESAQSRFFSYNNYIASTAGQKELRFGSVEYDSVFSGIASFNNPFLQRYNMNGYTTGKGYQMAEVFNFTDEQRAWEIRRTGATNRNNLGSVSVSMEGASMFIGADTLSGLKLGGAGTAPVAASVDNWRNAMYRPYTNSNRDEWNISIRDGSNGFTNYDVLENRDSILVPIKVMEMGGASVNPATKDTFTTSTPNYPFWAFDDATAEYLVLKINIPVGVVGTTYKMSVEWYASATSGNVYWGVRPYYTAAGSDPESPTNGNWGQFVDAVHGTSGRKSRAVWNFTMPSGLQPGQSVYLFFRRNAPDGNDTMSGDAKVTDIFVTAYRAWGSR